MTLTIGQIEYANCTPIFTALQQRIDCTPYRFVRGVPARLNRLLAAGEIDVCPSSSIEYGKHADRYLILPELSISSVGAVKSVLLFSRLPLDELDGERIGMTTESDTSVALLRIILERFHGFRNAFERTELPVEQALVSYPALLLIGDAALKAALGQGGYFVFDLGELWYRVTGLPFVFALWLVRREAVARATNEVARLGTDLVRAKMLAYESYPMIAATTTERHWIAEDLLVDYWRTISYELTESHLRGVREFFAHAAELGLLGQVPKVELFGEDAGT